MGEAEGVPLAPVTGSADARAIAPLASRLVGQPAAVCGRRLGNVAHEYPILGFSHKMKEIRLFGFYDTKVDDGWVMLPTGAVFRLVGPLSDRLPALASPHARAGV